MGKQTKMLQKNNKTITQERELDDTTDLKHFSVKQQDFSFNEDQLNNCDNFSEQINYKYPQLPVKSLPNYVSPDISLASSKISQKQKTQNSNSKKKNPGKQGPSQKTETQRREKYSLDNHLNSQYSTILEKTKNENIKHIHIYFSKNPKINIEGYGSKKTHKKQLSNQDKIEEYFNEQTKNINKITYKLVNFFDRKVFKESLCLTNLLNSFYGVLQVEDQEFAKNFIIYESQNRFQFEQFKSFLQQYYLNLSQQEKIEESKENIQKKQEKIQENNSHIKNYYQNQNLPEQQEFFKKNFEENFIEDSYDNLDMQLKQNSISGEQNQIEEGKFENNSQAIQEENNSFHNNDSIEQEQEQGKLNELPCNQFQSEDQQNQINHTQEQEETTQKDVMDMEWSNCLQKFD